MSFRLNTDDEMTGAAVRWLIGFFGSMALIFVLPRLVRRGVRHYAFRLIGEIVAIVSFGLLAEKIVDWTAAIGRADEPKERLKAGQ